MSINKLKTEKIYNLSTYGLDIENELISILSREINREILRRLGIEPDRNIRRKNSIDKIFKSSE